MSEVATPIEQDGYNAYGYVDGKRVPVLSTSMGNCWGQDDQRAFCGHIVHCANNHERLVEMLTEAVSKSRANKMGWIQDASALLAQLQADKRGE